MFVCRALYSMFFACGGGFLSLCLLAFLFLFLLLLLPLVTVAVVLSQVVIRFVVYFVRPGADGVGSVLFWSLVF